MKKLLLYFAMLWLISACNNPEDARPVDVNTPTKGSYQNGVFIVNEGNFDWGVGTLSFLHDATENEAQQIDNLIFKEANEFELGNIFQSMKIIGGKGYLILNNSEKIVIIDPYTCKYLDQIDIPKGSPRYLEQVTDDKAYLTELYAGCFWVLDLKTNTVTKKVTTDGGWTEGIATIGDYAFITKARTMYDSNQADQELLKIDKNTDEIVDRMPLPKGPKNVVVDKNAQLWVLCEGQIVGDSPQLVRIDPEQMKITRQFSFDNLTATWPGHLRINREKNTLYYINGGVYQQPIDATTLNSQPFIPVAENQIYYGLDLDPANDDIYLSDAIDYLQKGLIFHYNHLGELISKFNADVMPNQFVFWRPEEDK